MSEEAKDDDAFIRALARLSQMDGLGIGLAGAHRTGKTSICEQLAEKNPFPFVRTSARELADRLGFDVNNPGTMEERLEFQEQLLLAFEETYAAQTGVFFADRTPYDMAAYMLSEVQTGEVDPALDMRINAYIEKCIEMANRYFGIICVIQPGIRFVHEPGTPTFNVGYQEKLNALMIGTAYSTFRRQLFVLDRTVTDLQRRVEIVASKTGSYLQNYFSMLNELPKQ